MLILRKATCCVCKKEFEEPIQYFSRTCNKCKKEYSPICDECAQKGCTCGGKLLTQQELDAKNGLVYLY